MAELTALRRSPLEHLREELERSAGGEVSVRERPFHIMTSIRVRPGSAAHGRIGAQLGAVMPDACGQTAIGAEQTTLWLGPDEWLVVSNEPASAQEDLASELCGALGGEPGSVVDVSANRTIIELCGSKARSLLEKGCPVDLHVTAFSPGQAVLTTVAHVPVLLWQTDVGTYRLLPRCSFADYLARWLLDAATEYDGPELP